MSILHCKSIHPVYLSVCLSVYLCTQNKRVTHDAQQTEDLCNRESACHLGHGLNISKWDDLPRLSQQSPMEWTHPAPSSSLWKPSCLLNEIIEPYEMCVISGEQIFVNDSRGLYSRSVLAWNLPDNLEWKGKESWWIGWGCRDLSRSPGAGQCPQDWHFRRRPCRLCGNETLSTA